MTCKELVELVTDYLDGKLHAVEVARFEQHLWNCGGCTAYLGQMRRTIQLVGYVHKDTLTSQQWQNLSRNFRDRKSS